MKRSIAILLLLAMILGVFAGCGKQGAEPTEAPTVAPTEETIPANAKEDLAAAAEYLKTYYKDALTLTARDYTRLGAVRVGLDQYPITWSVDVAEDIIKIVVNDDGTVTIDIADGIKEDTPYVLTATLTDAYGNVETVTFEYTIPASLGTMQEIVDMAYALENGEALEVEATLTGEIISVNTPYDAGYKNVTVTIKVAEREDFPIMCYRLKGEGADTITVGDTITVTGILKNYNGTIEFDAGCKLEEVIKGDLVFELPSDPKEIVDMAYALGVGESIPVKVTLTGKVTDFKETYTEQYKNISVWMTVEGRESKPILVYRVKGDEVAQVAVGDTITVSGSIINYNGTIEFTSGCSLDSRISGGGTPPSDPVSSFWGKVVNPGETYYMYMNIAGTKYYFTGKMDGKYLASSTNPGDAVEVTVEAADEYGRRFYFMDNGTKKYIEIYEYTRDDGKNRGAVSIVEVPSAVFYWNTDAHTYVVYGGITGDPYFMGTYGTYTTFSVSSTYYITGNNAANAGVTQYIADFMTPDEAPAPEEPPVVEDNYVTNPVVGTAYKLGLNQTQKGAIYYFTGVMSGFYGATDTDITKGVEVYLEEAEGGYYLTFNDAAGNKQYVYIEISGTHTNFKFGETKAVFTWDAEKATLSTKVGDEVCYIGTYGSYVTFGGMATSKLSEDTYFGHLYLSDGSTPEQPEQPEQPEEPDVPATGAPVVGTAYKLYSEQGNVGKTLYFSGTTANKDYYLSTTENVAEAVDVYVEEVDGGYRMYFDANGTKTYIDAHMSGTYLNIRLTTSPTAVFTYNAEYNTLVTNVDGTEGYIGTYGTYTTLSASKMSFISTSFPSHLVAVGGSSEPEVPEVNEDEEAAKAVDALIDAIGTVTKDSEAAIKAAREAYNKLTDAQKALVTKLAVLEAAEKALEELNKPTEPETPAGAPVVGTAYKLYSEQGNVGKTLYFSGTTANKDYYLSTTENVAEAVDVYVEEVDGGYRMYFDANGTKTYIDAHMSGTYLNIRLTTSPTAVFTYNAEYNTLVTNVDGTEGYIGTYGTYTTLSASKMSFISTSFPSHLVAVGGSSEPEVPEVNEDEEAAKAVDALIDAIGTVTKDSEAAIKAARDAYNALTDAQKALVTKLAVLEAAEAALEELNKPEEPEVPVVPEAPANATYVMADYVVSGELGGGEVVRDLDSNVKLTISSGWITSDTARIYKNGNAVIESKHPINSIVLNAGYKDSTFDVYTSEDGTSWNKHSNVAFTSAYADVTINFATPVKYIKLDCPNAQLRFKILTVNFAGGSAPVEPTPDPDQEAADAVIALIDAIGEVTLEKEEAIVAARAAYDALSDAQKALVTNLETLTAAEAALEELKKPAEPEVPTDPVEIVKAAYALEEGAFLPYTATLTGKVILVNDAYSTQYKNITVTIEIAGAETMPITCFRLKGTEAETLNVNDIITVTGNIKNHYGTIEFDAGCTLDAVTQMDPPAEGGGEDVEGALLATFTFPNGNNGEWTDGNSFTNETYTDGSYSLNLTNGTSVYNGGWDYNNNGFIKFGTSSKVGSLTITVPENVDTVELYLSGYKAKTSKYTINGGSAKTLTKSANNSEYDVVVIDTTENKTITISTVSGATRMVMYSVLFYGTKQ